MQSRPLRVVHGTMGKRVLDVRDGHHHHADDYRRRPYAL